MQTNRQAAPAHPWEPAVPWQPCPSSRGRAPCQSGRLCWGRQTPAGGRVRVAGTRWEGTGARSLCTAQDGGHPAPPSLGIPPRQRAQATLVGRCDAGVCGAGSAPPLPHLVPRGDLWQVVEVHAAPPHPRPKVHHPPVAHGRQHHSLAVPAQPAARAPAGSSQSAGQMPRQAGGMGAKAGCWRGAATHSKGRGRAGGAITSPVSSPQPVLPATWFPLT